MKRLIIFIISLALYAPHTFGVQKVITPQIGQPMPDFTLSHITYFEKTQASLSDFKGKWLVLDFWTMGCTICIQSLPKVNNLYKTFQKDVYWMMVGVTGKKNGGDIQKFYEQLRSRKNFELPVAYDSVLAKEWNIRAVPHIIVVDPRGITRFITDGRDLSAEKIQDILENKPVTLYEIGREALVFDPAKISFSTNKSNDPLLVSFLSRWNGEVQYAGFDIDTFIDGKVYLRESYRFAMVPLYALYNYAFFGRWSWNFQDSIYANVYPYPILEVKDASLFDHDYNHDVGKGMYNYCLAISPEDVSRSRIMQLMQEDLKKVFKFEAHIETRKVPVWELVAEKGVREKLRSQGGEPYITPGSTTNGFTLRNYDPAYLNGALSFYIRERHREPFLDATGITFNIDFSIEGDLTTLEGVNDALRPHGMHIRKGTRKMKVLVIR